jgi:ketosteroid isomerase-like protein
MPCDTRAVTIATLVTPPDVGEHVSVANTQIVQQLYAAFNDRDIPAILARLASDVEWSEPPNPYNPTGGTRRGHEGFLQWVQIGQQAEDILVLEPYKMLTDQDSVAVVGHMKCRAIATGKIYESDFIHLVTLRDGKVAKFQEFFDTYAASEAFR